MLGFVLTYVQKAPKNQPNYANSFCSQKRKLFKVTDEIRSRPKAQNTKKMQKARLEPVITNSSQYATATSWASGYTELDDVLWIKTIVYK